jgi:hypothetical protein
LTQLVHVRRKQLLRQSFEGIAKEFPPLPHQVGYRPKLNQVKQQQAGGSNLEKRNRGRASEEESAEAAPPALLRVPSYNYKFFFDTLTLVGVFC